MNYHSAALLHALRALDPPDDPRRTAAPGDLWSDDALSRLDDEADAAANRADDANDQLWLEEHRGKP